MTSPCTLAFLLDWLIHDLNWTNCVQCIVSREKHFLHVTTLWVDITLQMRYVVDPQRFHNLQLQLKSLVECGKHRQLHVAVVSYVLTMTRMLAAIAITVVLYLANHRFWIYLWDQKRAKHDSKSTSRSIDVARNQIRRFPRRCLRLIAPFPFERKRRSRHRYSSLSFSKLTRKKKNVDDVNVSCA